MMAQEKVVAMKDVDKYIITSLMGGRGDLLDGDARNKYDEDKVTYFFLAGVIAVVLLAPLMYNSCLWGGVIGDIILRDQLLCTLSLKIRPSHFLSFDRPPPVVRRPSSLPSGLPSKIPAYLICRLYVSFPRLWCASIGPPTVKKVDASTPPFRMTVQQVRLSSTARQSNKTTYSPLHSRLRA